MFCMTLFISISNAQEVNSDISEWFVWEPKNSLEPGVIGMSDWLDKPTGGHGH